MSLAAHSLVKTLSAWVLEGPLNAGKGKELAWTLDLLILGSDLCLGMGFFLLARHMRHVSRSLAHLSLQSFAALVLCRCLHLGSHLFGIHFTPEVLPGWVYNSVDLFNAVAGLVAVAAAAELASSSSSSSSSGGGGYQAEADSFGKVCSGGAGSRSSTFAKKILPKRLVPFAHFATLYLVVFALAGIWTVFRRGGHSSSSSSLAQTALSFFCCFYEVLGALALVPQLYMVHAKLTVDGLNPGISGGQDKSRNLPALADLVFCVFLSKFFTLLFWFLYPYIHRGRHPDNRGVQMAAEGLNMAILSDFLVVYVMAGGLGRWVAFSPFYSQASGVGGGKGEGKGNAVVVRGSGVGSAASIPSSSFGYSRVPVGLGAQARGPGGQGDGPSSGSGTEMAGLAGGGGSGVRSFKLPPSGAGGTEESRDPGANL